MIMWQEGFAEWPEGWFLIGVIVIADLVLRGFALWKAAQNKQKWWFVAILVINSLGILPAVYLLINRKQFFKTKKKK